MLYKFLESGPSCSSSSRDGSGVSVSKELLMAGSGGRGGIWDRLLIDSKPNSRKNSTLQTVRIERSPLLDQVRTFLPQMAQANEKLRKEMAAAPPGHFNIENTDETLGQVIQILRALFFSISRLNLKSTKHYACTYHSITFLLPCSGLLLVKIVS